MVPFLKMQGTFGFIVPVVRRISVKLRSQNINYDFVYYRLQTPLTLIYLKPHITRGSKHIFQRNIQIRRKF